MDDEPFNEPIFEPIRTFQLRVPKLRANGTPSKRGILEPFTNVPSYATQLHSQWKCPCIMQQSMDPVTISLWTRPVSTYQNFCSDKPFFLLEMYLPVQLRTGNLIWNDSVWIHLDQNEEFDNSVTLHYNCDCLHNNQTNEQLNDQTNDKTEADPTTWIEHFLQCTHVQRVDEI